MFAAQFDYQKAATVSEAIQILHENSEAKLLAGGQSLIPLMKLRLARPTTVVDIGGIEELKGIAVAGDKLRIGPLTTHSELVTSPEIQNGCWMLSEAAEGIGDPAVRNRGTVGGNVSHADPASDLPIVLTALNAEFTVQGQGGILRGGSRTMDPGEFFTGAFTTGLEGDEVLTQVEIPVLQADQKAEYAKMAHPATSFALVGAAVVVTVDGDNRCSAASVAVGGLTPAPVKAVSVENALTGNELTDAVITLAAEQVGNDLGPDIIGDVFASAEYRRAMAAIELKHALFHAVGLSHH